MTNLLRDVSFALRQLRGRPAFTAIAITVLALGLGSTAAIFSVVNAVLLKPLPYPHPESLVSLFESDVIATGPEDAFNVVSPGLFDEWRQHARSISVMSAVRYTSFNISSNAASFNPERINGLACSSTFPRVLGFQPVLGRFFNEAEDQYEAPHVAVLSYGFWQQHFGGSHDVLGQQIRLDGENYDIVGVLPKSFVYPGEPARVFVPFRRTLDKDNLTTFSNHFFYVIGRLEPGYTVKAAQEELSSIVKNIRRTHPTEVMGTFATVALLNKRVVADVQTALIVLLGAVGCLLLIACVNIANLLLTRALGRQRELAIRFALGASRLQIIRQVLVESTLISFFGAAGGLIIANWMSSFLAANAPGADNLPQAAHIHIDSAVLAFTFFLALLSGIAAGLFPALIASRNDLMSGMRQSSRSATETRSHALLRQVFVGAEIALSLVLLIGAGLLLHSFFNLQNVRPGFRSQNSVSFEISLPEAHYKTRQSVSNFVRRLVDDLRSTPGVTSAGLVSYPPLAGHWSDSVFHIEGHPLPPGKMMDLLYRAVDPQYFQAVGIPLIRGRTFIDSDGVGFDEKHPKPGQVIISKAAAEKFFKKLNPIGQVLEFGTDAGLPPDPSGNPIPVFQIIGIVGDVPTDAATGIEPTIYFPLFNGDNNYFFAVVHTTGAPLALSGTLSRRLHRLDPDLPVHNLRTFEQINAQATSDRRFSVTLLTLFASVAVLLAAVGLYGVVSYNVSQKTAEIGIRMALGAERAQIGGSILLDGMKPAVIGMLSGFAAAFALAHVLKSMLFQVSTFDPITFAVVPAVLLATAALACLAPALRASSVHPTAALRTE